MSNYNEKLCLVGDNPFHGISHLSQEKARSRFNDGLVDNADLVLTAVKNGADGFMFSVSEVTLSILEKIRERGSIDKVKLYAIVPYAFEYVRIATQYGTPNLLMKMAKQIAISRNTGAMLSGTSAIVKMNPKNLMETYLAYEISRIKSTTGKKVNLTSLLLHEVVTDMGLALNFDWLFKSFISYLSRRGITPGFNSRNFPYLIRKFREWKIDTDGLLLAVPFNQCGFQMNPSREEYEKTLSSLSSPIVLAISVLAAGYYTPSQAADYLGGLSNLRGVVAGVSNQKQASETFSLFSSKLKSTGYQRLPV